ncbi:MAG TPA: hypothetical protein VE546_23480 [Streptomyces sp.]|uniref:hypothetical protein n=1 Tax=Streptomyces sp. TaxID=1931 RepID=UPI002D4397A0|nr:hypothetical protein [Streptomyces sp.]HZG06499.1 hypothetical protein [Streptomyces sp.]
MAFTGRDKDGDVAGGGSALWSAQLGAHIAKLQSDLNRIKARGYRNAADEEVAHKAEQHLKAARDILEQKLWPPSALRSRLFGGLPYAALSNVHEAEVEILQLTPEEEAGRYFEKVLVQARLHLKPDDPRLVRLVEEARRRAADRTGGTGSLTPHMKQLAVDALHAAYEAEDSEKARVRDFVKMVRRYTVILISLTALLLFLFGLDAAGSDGGLTGLFCFTPYGQDVCPTGDSASFFDVLLICLFGLLGAALTGVASLRDMRSTAQPYHISWWLLLLKLPVGAIAAVVGIILIRADVIPGLTDLDSAAQILFWALVFGALQESITRAVDEQGRYIISNVRSPERGLTDPPRSRDPLTLRPEDQAARPGQGPAAGAAETQVKALGESGRASASRRPRRRLFGSPARRV